MEIEAWVALIAALATTLSAGFIGWQAWETRRSAESSSEAAEASEAALVVANGSLSSTGCKPYSRQKWLRRQPGPVWRPMPQLSQFNSTEGRLLFLIPLWLGSIRTAAVSKGLNLANSFSFRRTKTFGPMRSSRSCSTTMAWCRSLSCRNQPSTLALMNMLHGSRASGLMLEDRPRWVLRWEPHWRGGRILREIG